MKKKLMLSGAAALLTLSAAFFFTGCREQTRITSLKQQKLFTLNYGSFEDEIKLFSLGSTGEINTHLYMKDGFFYIVNGESKKVLQMTSYGDLTGIYFNPDVNPPPSFSAEEETVLDSSAVKTTKQAVRYPFNKLGTITADTAKNFFVVDQLPSERHEMDVEEKIVLRDVILRFSADGTFIDYLGQEGPGGTPFPYIKEIFTTKNNELITVCLNRNGSVVYWFSSAGYLKYKLPFTFDSLPAPPGEKRENFFISLDGIIPDFTRQRLYVKIDYHSSEIDQSSKVESGISYKKTLLFPLDVSTGLYETPITIPPYEQTVSDGFSKMTYTLAYDFLGVTESGWFFFIITDDSGFMVQIVQPNGQKIIQRQIDSDHKTVVYHDFSLSGNGIISALFAGKEKAEAVWWRTDTLIESFLQ